MWKHLVHPNILPLLGATVTPLQLISDWMPGGDLPNYIRKNPNVDRLGLVGVPSCCNYLTLTSFTSFLVSPRASATSTPAMSSMGTSREYVVFLDILLSRYSHLTSRTFLWMTPVIHASPILASPRSLKA